MSADSVIHKIYLQKCSTVSDINEHLPTLFKYGSMCKIIAEYGVREVCSTYAFAATKPEKLICVDLKKHSNVDEFLQQCKNENINTVFYESDTLSFQLEHPVDLLFIDTLHTYFQLANELEINHRNVNKFIILHDTTTFSTTDEFDTQIKRSPIIKNKQGLATAVEDFLNAYPNWKLIESYQNNNGLTVLGKT